MVGRGDGGMGLTRGSYSSSLPTITTPSTKTLSQGIWRVNWTPDVSLSGWLEHVVLHVRPARAQRYVSELPGDLA